MTGVYYKVSDYYKDTYKEKVYKLPIKLPLTCPNRDGACGFGGCIYCSETGGKLMKFSIYLAIIGLMI